MADTIREDRANLPYRRDISIRQGRAWEESYTVSICPPGSDTADLIDFTDADSGQIRFKASDGTVAAAIALDEMSIDGNCTVRLTAAQTTALEAGRQRWELYFSFPIGSTQFPDGDSFALLAGTAVVTESIPAS